MIGGGIDAIYTICPPGKIEPGKTLTLFYNNLDRIEIQINYTIIEEIGSGNSGIVYLIKNTDKTDTKEYIFKILNYTPDKLQYPLYNEGKISDELTDILNADTLVLYQGKLQSDFLISTYNGKSLYQEFKLNKKQIKEKYALVTTQLLELLELINSNNIFHNDIKLDNITFKDNIVYLIDFGLLTRDKSDIGSIISMSYKGLIFYIKELEKKLEDSDKPFSTIISELLNKKILIDTDIFGFFYCCIDLLFLTVFDFLSTSYHFLFSLLNIKTDNNLEQLYRLFELYYFILPTTIRETLPNIKSYNDYDEILPTIFQAKDIFNTFSDDNTNLFRFMTFIYFVIHDNITFENEEQKLWYKKFLKCMSNCFLPTFNYDSFKLTFNEIVSEFSASHAPHCVIS